MFCYPKTINSSGIMGLLTNTINLKKKNKIARYSGYNRIMCLIMYLMVVNTELGH